MRGPIVALVRSEDVRAEAERIRKATPGARKLHPWAGALTLGARLVQACNGRDFDSYVAIQRSDVQYGMAPLRKNCVRPLAEIGAWSDDDLPEGVLLASGWQPHFNGGIALGAEREHHVARVRETLANRRETHWAVGYIIHF